MSGGKAGQARVGMSFRPWKNENRWFKITEIKPWAQGYLRISGKANNGVIYVATRKPNEELELR